MKVDLSNSPICSVRISSCLLELYYYQHTILGLLLLPSELTFPIIMEFPSLFIILLLGFRSTLSNNDIATPSSLSCLCGMPNFSSFYIQSVCFCRQHKFGYCFLNQFNNLCLFIRVLTPFRFNVINDII